MRQLTWSVLLSLLVVSKLPAQTRTIAERLGHPRDAKLLILHADDLGVAHSENAASFDALDKGAINVASVMIQPPWVTEVAEYAKKNPNADLGLHLTDAFGSRWRQQDYDVLTSAEFKQALKDNNVVLVTWREIQRAMYPAQ